MLILIFVEILSKVNYLGESQKLYKDDLLKIEKIDLIIVGTHEKTGIKPPPSPTSSTPP